MIEKEKYIEKNSYGNIIVEGFYKNEKKTGKWIYYNNEGTILKEETFEL